MPYLEFTEEERKAFYGKNYSLHKKKVSDDSGWNKTKTQAQHLAWKAIQSGKLIRQPCEVCGDVTVHAHHDDYHYPLAVRWLCPKHHYEHHKINGYQSPPSPV